MILSSCRCLGFGFVCLSCFFCCCCFFVFVCFRWYSFNRWFFLWTVSHSHHFVYFQPLLGPSLISLRYRNDIYPRSYLYLFIYIYLYLLSYLQYLLLFLLLLDIYASSSALPLRSNPTPIRSSLILHQLINGVSSSVISWWSMQEDQLVCIMRFALFSYLIASFHSCLFIFLFGLLSNFILFLFSFWPPSLLSAVLLFLSIHPFRCVNFGSSWFQSCD